MPTDAHPNILDREIAVSHSKPASESAAQLIHEITNFGTQILQRSQVVTMQDAEASFAPLALYRHMLELTDAVEVLVRNSCVVPAAPLVRASFEALLALAFIHQDDAAFRSRSLAWSYMDALQRVRSLERWVPGSALHSEFERERQQDPFKDLLGNPEPERLTRELQMARAMRDEPSFAPCAAELERMRRAGRRGTPPWYALFDGPGSLKELAERVGLLMHYRFQYRHWSKFVHAADPSQYVDAMPDGRVGVRPLRQANEVLNITQSAANHAIHAMWLTIRRLCPQENPAAREWYAREVRPSLVALRQALRASRRWSKP